MYDLLIPLPQPTDIRVGGLWPWEARYCVTTGMIAQNSSILGEDYSNMTGRLRRV
jgi:hypothetical protein